MKPVRRAAFHRPLSTLASIFLLFVLSGCISPQLDRPAALRDYENARPCCTSFSTAKIERLELSSITSFQIDKCDQAFDFGGDGISFFKLFEVPEDSQTYVCRVVSHSSADGRALNVFFPKVTFLDGQFSVVRESTEGDFRGAGPTSSKMGGVEILVRIDPRDHIKYIVVHTAKGYVQNGREVQLTPRPGFPTAGAVPYIASAIMHDTGAIHFLGSPISLENNMGVLCDRPAQVLQAGEF
jgi:hypothetical protein